LLHNIGWTHEDYYGTFVLDNGSVNTYKLKDLEKANDRTVKGNCFSDYRNGLDKGKQQIAEARQKLEPKVGDRGEDEAEGNWHTVMKFTTKEGCPYLVRWATKPFSEISVTAGELLKLVNNHVFCIQYEIFAGIVGTIILWPCQDEAFKNKLRYVRVMRLYKDLNKYKLHFRDGRTFYITPEHLDSAVTP
jgi:hypothetical protein